MTLDERLASLRRLGEHAAWADGALLEALRGEPELAPDAIREYLHVLGAAETWLARIEGRPPTVAVWPDPGEHEAGPLRERVATGYRALVRDLEPSDLARPIHVTNAAGATFGATLEHVLLHVALHGQYHRGKANALLRAAGGVPASVDFIAFVRGLPATVADARVDASAPAPSASVPNEVPGRVRLEHVTMANRGDLDDIEPGAPERYLVHSNWYWHQMSLERPLVSFRLVHGPGGGEAVGMVAYGPRYADRDLRERVSGDFEVYHLVIDHRHRGRGIGRAVIGRVLAELRALPACRRVVVAIHPDNARSRAFFGTFGARPLTDRNVDGDPMYELVAAAVRAT